MDVVDVRNVAADAERNFARLMISFALLLLPFVLHLHRSVYDDAILTVVVNNR